MSAKRTVRIRVLEVLALSAWAVAAHAGEYGARLRAADRVRTTEPAEFDRRLAALEQDRAQATAVELEHLRLLQDYRKLLRGDYQGAFGDAIALSDQAKSDEVRFRSALLVANTAAAAREFLLGLRYLDRALELKPRIADVELGHSALIVAGQLHNQYGQFDRGRQYAQEALEQSSSMRWRCYAQSILMEALHGLDKQLDEEGHVSAALQICATAGEPIPANIIRSTLAASWAKQGKHQQAIALLEAHLPEVLATSYPWLIGQVHGQLAEYRLKLGKRDTAEDAARIAVRRGGGGHSSAVVTAHHVLYRLALDRGNARDALLEYQRYAEAEKARLDEAKAREYAFQLSRHEIAQKNQSIALLKNQNQVLRLQQEVARKDKSNAQLLIAMLVVLASSLAYWGWRARRMHRTLRQLAQTDSLTGLANRRHFRAQTETLLADARERGRPISVLLFDLDHFKQINDRCGHATGDWVLKEVARVGRLQCRPGDVLGRIGGEEFALTLLDCDLGDAEVIAERMREAIAAIDGRPQGCELPVSASIGCVAASVSGHEYETLVAHADAAMYRAKVGGRNRVSRYQTASVTAVPTPVRLESVPVARLPDSMRAS